jgi:hypothetical protein
VNEKDFLAKVDDLALEAFDDQCTGQQSPLPADRRDQGLIYERILRESDGSVISASEPMAPS